MCDDRDVQRAADSPSKPVARRQAIKAGMASIPFLLMLKARPAIGHNGNTSGLSGMSRPQQP